MSIDPKPSHDRSVNPICCGRTRRQFLWEMGAGFTGLALTSILSGDGFFARHGLFAAESNGRRPT